MFFLDSTTRQIANLKISLKKKINIDKGVCRLRNWKAQERRLLKQLVTQSQIT